MTSVKAEHLIIPPLSKHSACEMPSRIDQSGLLPQPEKVPYSSPDLHQVVVVPRTESPKRPGPSPKQFRVGSFRLQRSRTWPQYSGQQNQSKHFGEPYVQRPRAVPSAPKLQAKPPTKMGEPNVNNMALRRRQTWPTLTRNAAKHHGMKYETQQEKCKPRFTGPRQGLEPLEHVIKKVDPPKFDDMLSFWESYNKMADFEDKEFVKTLGGNLDTLLIFAGLFSSVNTAFIVEAFHAVQEDRGETTNKLIRSVILVLHNSTFTDNSLHDEHFIPKAGAFRSTVVFFVSLCFSLTAAFGAVLGKQWLNYYEREGGLKPLPGRGRERQKKYLRRDQWRMEGVIETLPTLLQLSLFLFLIALVDFLWPINKRLAHIVMGFSLTPAVLYATTTLIAVIHPSSPFQTRLSITLHWTLSQIRPLLVRFTWWLLVTWEAMLAFIFKLPEWRPPWGRICAIPAWVLLALTHTPLLAVALLFILVELLGFAFALMINFALIRIRRAKMKFTRKIPPSQASGSSNKKVSHPSSAKLSPSPDDLANIQCLDTLIQRASLPQDLSVLLPAISSLPLSIAQYPNHPSMKSLIKSTNDRVLAACYSGQGQGPVSFNVKQLLRLIHVGYIQLKDGPNDKDLERDRDFPWAGAFMSVGGRGDFDKDANEDKYLLSRDGDRWLVQELFDSVIRDPLDASSASILAEVIAAAPIDVTCSKANLEVLYQVLERPSWKPESYLSYISLLSLVAHSDKELSNLQSARFHHALVSSMWMNDLADLDYFRGRLRVRKVSENMDSMTDEYRFSEYLAQWRREGPITSNGRISSEKFNSDYLECVVQLLDIHGHNPFWPEQLERDGHEVILLDLLVHSKASNSGQALYSFLRLWHTRRNIGSLEVSAKYVNARAVQCLFRTWEHTIRGVDDNGKPRLMELTMSYLEEAKSHQLLDGLDLTMFIIKYKEYGTWYLKENDEREMLFERVDHL